MFDPVVEPSERVRSRGCARVGLVANPQSGADVRRLTSLARSVDVHERCNLVARAVRGLAATGVEEVVALDDPTHGAERAWDLLARSGSSSGPTPRLRLLPGVAGDAAATTAGARALRADGVGNVLTVGGDGTHRAVAAGWPDVVLASIPAGTNNAFARGCDPTVVGLAAGLHSADPERWSDFAATVPHLQVEVVDDDDRVDPVLDALVDLVAVRGSWVGARAVWDPGLLLEAVVVEPDPTALGLAGVAGMAVGCGHGPVHLRFGEGDTVLAPLGPGQLAEIGLASAEPLGLGAVVEVGGAGVTLAFDGEREVVLGAGRRARVRVEQRGPRRLDAGRLVGAAADAGVFTRGRRAELDGSALCAPLPEGGSDADR
ncbi:MAG: diacylglycerol kinase family protein [Acidimicrobiales bacterium]